MDIKRMDAVSKAAAVKYARQVKQVEPGSIRDEGKVSSKGAGRKVDDKIVLSQEAKDLNRIREMLMSLPDVDNEKIQDVKIRLDSGAYRVDSRALAEKLLKK